MRKLKFIALAMGLVLLLAAFPLGVGAVTADTTVDGVTVPLADEEGLVVLPEAPAYTDGRVFLGWYAEDSGQKVFLPAKASYAPQGEVHFTAVAVQMATSASSSARVKGNEVGLRFTSDIRLADYEDLVAKIGKENFSFGTYIVAASYLEKTKNVFTPEALAAAGYSKYIDVPTKGYYKLTSLLYTWSGSVTGILPGNYTRDYAGIGYIALQYTDGSSARVQCPFSVKKHVQAVYKTVLAAYEDRSIHYEYLVVDENGTSHSPYTVDQLAAMKSFLDDLVSIKFRTKTAEEKRKDPADCYFYYLQSGQFYKSPWQLSIFYDRRAQLVTITVTPPEGRSVDSLKGLAMGGSNKDLSQVKKENGTFVFQFDEYSPAF